MLVRESIIQPIAQHAINNLHVPHATTPTAGRKKIWRAVHVLHPTGNYGSGSAEGDFLSGRYDSLRAGAAYAHSNIALDAMNRVSGKPGD